MAPKWLQNSDTLTIGAIVIDDIDILGVFQHEKDEYSSQALVPPPDRPSDMSD